MQAIALQEQHHWGLHSPSIALHVAQTPVRTALPPDAGLRHADIDFVRVHARDAADP